MGRSTPFLVLVIFVTLCAGCRSPVDAGEPCFDSAECEGGAICVSTSPTLSGAGGAGGEGGNAGADRFCMFECSEDVILCENEGEACVRSRDDDSIYVCLPGGDRVVGAVCATSFDCTVGSVCVQFTEGSVCRPLCDPAVTGLCPLGLECIAFDDDESRGFCEVPVVDPAN